MCASGIYSSIPLARNFQKLIYQTVGKEFFTYLVFAVIAAGLITLLYFFIFRLKIKSASQYLSLIFCAGLYTYFTIQLRGNPEEAIHLLEYGLLSFFVYRALSYRIRDWTIYITAAFLVMLCGTIDEFLQWMMPFRYWSYKDIGINVLGGVIFLLAIWKGIKPSYISGPVRSHSVRIMVVVITLNLITMGLCLSNTPDNVKRYTSAINSLSWLQQEEPMTEYGYDHYDPEIGNFNTRFTIDEIRSIDTIKGSSYGRDIFNDINAALSRDKLLEKYGAGTNPFLYEFLKHYFKRTNGYEEFFTAEIEKEKSEAATRAFAENLILNKYFGNTLKQSGLTWSSDKEDKVRNAASAWKDNYSSTTGTFIISFSQKTARMVLLLALFAVWIGGEIWKRNLSAG